MLAGGVAAVLIAGCCREPINKLDPKLPTTPGTGFVKITGTRVRIDGFYFNGHEYLSHNLGGMLHAESCTPKAAPTARACR